MDLTASLAYFRDSRYRCISTEDMTYLVDHYRHEDPPYQADRFDCDDSGDTFMADIKRGWCDASDCPEALAFGWVWLQEQGAASSHWMIWQLDHTLVLQLWEPQDNRIVKPSIVEVIAYGA
jgi:hypothetical protein